MPVAAVIQINGVAASDDNLPINTLVTLNSQNAAGAYLWQILDQPPGAADALSSAVVKSPTFTPTKEGSYLIKLTLDGLTTDQRIAGVRQLISHERQPAAGETTEVDATDGWATAVNSLIRRLDGLAGDAGVIVAENASAGMTAGWCVRLSSVATIKSGLPGQTVIPKGYAASGGGGWEVMDCIVGICEGRVDGVAGVAIGELMRVRVFGLSSVAFALGYALGTHVYTPNVAGLPSSALGTPTRPIGYVVQLSGGVNRILVNGFYGPRGYMEELALHGTLAVTGTSTLAATSVATLVANAAAHLMSTLEVDAAATLHGTLTADDAVWNYAPSWRGQTDVNNAASPLALTSVHHVVKCLPTTGAIVLNLPSAAAASYQGFEYIVADNDGGAAANPITINAAGGETIAGAASYVLAAPWGAIKLISDKVSNWVMVG